MPSDGEMLIKTKHKTRDEEAYQMKTVGFGLIQSKKQTNSK